jgi:hypothetical protein
MVLILFMDLRDGPCPHFCRLVDGHNRIDGLKRWTMSDIFRLTDGHILICEVI